MSMRKVFAANLRRLSEQKKSHAHVARELGLNRQQFDNYLKGINLPNESVVSRILEYFQVDLSYMFSDNKSETGYNRLIEKHKTLLDSYIDQKLSSKPGGLQDGLYYVIFSMSGEVQNFACSLLAVRREGGITTFKRVTRLRGDTGIFKSTARDVHSGIVIYRDGMAFLMALDVTQQRLPSLLVASPVVSREVIYSGVSLISTGSRFDVIKFCICPVQKRTKIWSAMRKVSFLSANELDSAFPHVRQFF